MISTFFDIVFASRVFDLLSRKQVIPGKKDLDLLDINITRTNLTLGRYRVLKKEKPIECEKVQVKKKQSIRGERRPAIKLHGAVEQTTNGYDSAVIYFGEVTLVFHRTLSSKQFYDRELRGAEIRISPPVPFPDKSVS